MADFTKSILTRVILVLFLLFLGPWSLSFLIAQSSAADGERKQEIAPTTDPQEIIRRSLESDRRNWRLAQKYTYTERRLVKVLDKHGASKHQQLETYDVTILYGLPYSRLVQKDDKPLSDKEREKEEEKLNKFVAKHRGESEKEREKRLAKAEKEREEERAFSGDILNAYDFKLVGEERVDGIDADIIEATPRKGFHPTQPHADMLSKMRGRLWVSKKDYAWVKIEGETLDTISFGFFLLRMHQGSRFAFEQTRVNDEIWFPRRVWIDASARFAVFMNGALQFQSDFSNYKKFATSTQVLPGVRENLPDSPNPDQPK